MYKRKRSNDTDENNGTLSEMPIPFKLQRLADGHIGALYAQFQRYAALKITGIFLI